MLQEIIPLATLTVFALASFGCALVFYDMWLKERAKRLRDRSRLADCARQQMELRENAVHWCQEVIRLDRLLALEYGERRRWERAHAERLPESVS